VTYEPLGVAVFAVGTLVLYTERFRAVLFASDVDDPVVVLDGADRVRDFNAAAAAAFPALDDAVGRPLDTAVPPLRGALAKADEAADRNATMEEDGAAAEPPVVAVPGADGTRYFRPATVPVALADPDDGRRLVLTDVTETERQRQALKRQNERLERFASAVSHDLRNPLNAASAQLDIARRKLDTENRHLAAVATEQDRMGEMISDLLTLAREGRDIDDLETVSLRELAGDCWSRVDPEGGGPELRITGDLQFRADPDRLRQVLENLFRNALEHAAENPADLTVGVGPLADGPGFYVADDGNGISENRRENVFETGHTTADGGTGFGLTIVREFVTAHGWEVRVVESAEGGARFEISGVEAVG
jgi:signal transduction histidine kinase